MLVACGVLATALGLGGWVLASRIDGPRSAGPVPKVAVPRAPAGHEPSLLRYGGRVRVARPVRLVIPAIGVSTRLTRLGLTTAHTLQVPASPAVAGWYTGSPRPGAIGSSVIAGHIDSHSGPGVFFRLRHLRPGERVYVVRADHTVAVFLVTAVRSYPKDRFPGAAVYGPVPDAELRLITCGGLFDHATGSYLSNVVVYTILIRHRTRALIRHRTRALIRYRTRARDVPPRVPAGVSPAR
jgi:hypothetical protein